ncbi:hypothetical protein HAX54_007315 [Datura stramonium]|uniref:Uncharacterized protein n=1 Tax=Datura stramonium TaxID=4076 RepID=A0ABS8TBK5_DATST|nr:hypothetical protein [Datura stramonium]
MLSTLIFHRRGLDKPLSPLTPSKLTELYMEQQTQTDLQQLWTCSLLGLLDSIIPQEETQNHEKEEEEKSKVVIQVHH